MVEKVRAHAEREVALVSVVLTTHHSETIFSFYMSFGNHRKSVYTSFGNHGKNVYTSFGNQGKTVYTSFGNHGKKLPSFFQEMKH